MPGANIGQGAAGDCMVGNRMRKRRGLLVWSKSGGRVGWLTGVCALVCGNKSNKS